MKNSGLLIPNTIRPPASFFMLMFLNQQAGLYILSENTGE